MSGTYSRENVEQLFQAASSGNLNIIFECINWKNIPVDITDESGLTPLMEASRYGKKEIVETLIKTYKCSINAQDKHGFTALHWAIETVFHPVIAVLLQCGASLTIKNEKGQTAGEMAKCQGKYYIFKMIEDVEKEQNRIRQGCLKALKVGSVLVQLVTVLLVGPPGVGKSSLSHSLAGKMLPNRRRSSGSVSFSPRIAANHSTSKPITWTELSFDEVLSTTANMIAPIVAANISGDPIKHPQSSRRYRLLKSLGRTFKRLPQRLAKVESAPSLATTSNGSSMKLLPASLASQDELIIEDIIRNNTPPDEDRMKTFITIMDSGGQKAFLNLYPIFVHNPSLVIIVFKMTNDPDCIWKSLPKDEFYTLDGTFANLHQINHSVADLIKHTMANISTYTDYTNSGTVTRICCVGTHKDRVSAAAITAIDKQLTDLVQESGYAPLVINRSGKYTKLKTLFPVNNLIAGHPSLLDEVVQELKEIPLKFLTGGKMDNTLHEIPIRWMKLELQIREQCQLNGVKYMNYSEALVIALKDHQFEDEEEFLNMLQYFHNLSLLLHYHNIPYLKDMIIVDNNLIIEAVSKLVEFTLTGNGIPSCDFNNFKYCGVFSEDLLNRPDLRGEIDPQGLVQLLVSLNIASPLPERLYFMPCVLPDIEEFTESPDDFLNTHYGPQQFKSISIQFSSGSIPRGVFCSLVVCLMNAKQTATRWTLCRSSSPNHKEAFSNLATFTLPSGHRVSIHDKMSHCEIQIHHNNHETATVIHYDVLSTLLHVLQDVCTTMSLDADFRVGFQCFSKECAHSDSHFVLSQVSLPLNSCDAYSVCKLSGNLNRLTEDQEVWFKPPCLTRRDSTYCMDVHSEETHKLLSNHICDVSTKAYVSELLTYANSWSTEWEVIGLKLGLSPLKLKEIFMDRRLVTDCCRYMLLEWTRSVPKACYCKLVTALDELDLKEAAYRLAKDNLTGLATDCTDTYSKKTHKIYTNSKYCEKVNKKQIHKTDATHYLSMDKQLSSSGKVNISDCDITDEGATMIMKLLSTQNAFLEDFQMHNVNPVTIKITNIINVLRNVSTLKVLNFSCINLGGEAVNDVAAVICNNPMLQKLNISQNRFSSKIMQIIVALSKFSAIKSLNISKNQITDDRIEDMVFALAQCHKLEELDISHNLLTAVMRLAQAFRGHANLQILNLSNNITLFCGEIEFLVDVVLSINQPLINLNVCGKNIRPRFVEHPLRSPNNSEDFTLQKLYLSRFCPIKKFIFERDAITLPPIIIYAIEDCPITDQTITSYYIDHNGGTYYNQDHDFAIFIPPGAVSQGHSVEVKATASHFGPYCFPDKYHPISSFFWVSANYTFRKLVYLILSHHAVINTIEDVDNLCALQACVYNLTVTDNGKMVMNEISSGTYFDFDIRYCVVEVTHFCSFCMAKKAKHIPEYFVAHFYTYDKDNVYIAEVCFCPDNNNCKNVIRKQCDTKYGKSLSPFQPSFKFSKGESLFIPTNFSTVTGWHISRHGNVEIAYSSFEYWKRFNDKEELKQSEERHEYPPRFLITCFRTVPNEILSFNFNVTKRKEALHKVIAEYPVIKETTGLLGSSKATQTVSFCNFTTQKPNMGQLCKIVIPKVMAQWKDIAYISLQYDVPKVRAIEEKHRSDPKKCCQELFEEWMCTYRTGDSKTWKNLLIQLKQVEELTAVVEEISEKLTGIQHT